MSGNAGGVRNLRAMFENRQSDQSTSPPSRGRSPSDSAASAGSRQVSKVRASFVAVERPGDLSQAPQWGLRKASDVSSMAEVREENTQALREEHAPTSPHTAKLSIDGGLGSILKGSAFEGTPTKQKPAEAKVNGGSKDEPSTNGVASRAAAMVEKMKKNGNPGPPPQATLITTSTAQPVKNSHPRPVPSIQSPSSPKVKAPKTPTSPVATKMNIRGGPAKIKGVMESAKKASEAREALKKEQAVKSPVTSKTEPSPKVSTASAKIPSTVTQPTAASKNQRAVSEQTEKPTPKPRLSMLPTRLPSAVTAKTAASAAKTDTEPVVKRTQPRSSMASGGRPARMPSAVTAGTASTLAKKSSRASLANGDRPKSRVSTAGKLDESFLTRMARPTASSALKTHEKQAVTSKPQRATRTRKSDQSHTTSSEQEPVEQAAEEPVETTQEPTSTTQDDAIMPQAAIELPEGLTNGDPPAASVATKVETTA